MKILFLGPCSPVIEDYLKNNGHFVIRTEEPCSIDFIQNEAFEFCISYRYRYIIAKDVIDYFSDNIVNLHISFLPFNRGSDPIFWSCIENTPQGVSIHIIDEGIDTGAILLQKEINLDIETDTLKSAYKKHSEAIENLFIQSADKILNRELIPIPQKEIGTYHITADKNKLLYIIEEQWWDTPIKELIDYSNN